MRRYSWAVSIVMLLLVTGIALGQSTGSTTSTGSATSGTSAATTSSTGVAATIKQELKTMFTQLLVTEIQTVFQDLRTSLGLPAATTAATDPLSVLETFIVDAVNAASTQQASN